jgi:hypothetical protein
MNRLNSHMIQPHLVSLAVLSAIGYQKPASADSHIHAAHGLEVKHGTIDSYLGDMRGLATTNSARASSFNAKLTSKKQPGCCTHGTVISQTIFTEDLGRHVAFEQRSIH